MSGRNRDSVRQYFQELRTSDGKILAKCKQCGHEQSNKTTKMKKHVEECNESSSVIPSENNEIALVDTENQDSENVEEPSLKNSKIVQEVVDSFTIKTTENERTKIDVAIDNFFFSGCNTALSVAENELFTCVYFKHMRKVLRPGYKPSTKNALHKTFSPKFMIKWKK